MPQRSKTARASKESTKRKPEAKAPRNYSQKSRKATGTKSDRSRSTKRVTARGTKASAARSARSRSIKRVTARAAPVRFVPGGRNDNLEKIDHIVVLMMENRSFDHMLGYLKLEGSNPNVDGLDAEMSNSHNGTSYPAWGKTLLVIAYDEHGGFYDHVEPEDAPDNNPSFQTYGVRVPALVISPWVERGKVSHKLFDHTSIIKTILLRFCRQLDGTIPDMGLRVTNAEQLGSLLTLTAPREPTPIEAYQHLIERVAQWRVDGFKKRTMRQARGRAPERREVTEFQEGIEEARKRLRKEGLPEGQP